MDEIMPKRGTVIESPSGLAISLGSGSLKQKRVDQKCRVWKLLPAFSEESGCGRQDSMKKAGN